MIYLLIHNGKHHTDVDVKEFATREDFAGWWKENENDWTTVVALPAGSEVVIK